MKECNICGKTAHLLDAIVDGKASEVCNECAEIYDAVIIERPSPEKLRKTERVFTVRERLEELSGVRKKERLRVMEEGKTAFPETISYRLRKERERTGLTKEKLAAELGLRTEEIERVENGTEKPSALQLRKYEQFFKKRFVIEEQEVKREEAEEIKEERGPLQGLIEKAKGFFGKKREKVSETEIVLE